MDEKKTEKTNKAHPLPCAEKGFVNGLVFAYPFDTPQAIRRSNGLIEKKEFANSASEEKSIANANKIVAKENERETTILSAFAQRIKNIAQTKKNTR